MTCVVGIAYKGRVILGADSAGVEAESLSIRRRRDKKVFRNGEMIFGFTTSFRMGQLLEYNLTPPKRSSVEPFEYVVSILIPKIREVLTEGGYTKLEDGREDGGSFLLGIAGRLFMIDADFQVAENLENYDAVGCGEPFALGAMHACAQRPIHENPWPSANEDDPMIILTAGLEAAEHFSAGVCKPFHFIELELT